MRRIVFSSPTAVATFLIGLTVITVATSIFGWDPLPAFELPQSVRAPRIAQDTAYATQREEQMVRDIYSAVLDEDKSSTGRIVLEELTNRGGTLIGAQIAGRNVDGVQESTIANYEQRNREPRSLREFLADRQDITFLTARDEKALSRHDYIRFEDRFEKRFPGSQRLVTLSNVGFNADHTEALVYVSYYCGVLCAGGSFVVLKKPRNRWVVDYRIQLWVS